MDIKDLLQPIESPQEKKEREQAESGGEKKEIQPLDMLIAIEGHLKSIRSMLTFFTVLLVLGLIVQGCALLSGF